MRDRFKKLVSFSFNFTYTSLQDAVLEKKSFVFLLITRGIKKYWSRCATAEKNFFLPLNFTYNSFQGRVLEKKCLVFFC